MVTKSKPSGYIKVLKDVQAKAGAKICLLEAMSGMQSQAAELLRIRVCVCGRRESASFF